MIDKKRKNYHREEREDDLFSEVIQIKRVSKKTKGGNQISFTALIVVGDQNGRVGVGLGKGGDVLSAINKGKKLAKKRLFPVSRRQGTIFHDIFVKRGAAKVFLKPAPPGSGIIASQAIKIVMEAVGIRDISVKILGTKNRASNVYAVIQAFKELSTFMLLFKLLRS